MAARAQDIGTWFDILQAISTLAVIVNVSRWRNAVLRFTISLNRSLSVSSGDDAESLKAHFISLTEWPPKMLPVCGFDFVSIEMIPTL